MNYLALLTCFVHLSKKTILVAAYLCRPDVVQILHCKRFLFDNKAKDLLQFLYILRLVQTVPQHNGQDVVLLDPLLGLDKRHRGRSGFQIQRKRRLKVQMSNAELNSPPCAPLSAIPPLQGYVDECNKTHWRSPCSLHLVHSFCH